ncbi:hypothetical protein SAY86_011603 [Trapa natans]|uniref:Uncharacterized protein n=1 Tax=Trapa natans TaxID=22666 RepID=A0AAN7LLB6_TRANT|nr:hypothetical protein SAY86_011603 [Trapa natans]
MDYDMRCDYDMEKSKKNMEEFIIWLGDDHQFAECEREEKRWIINSLFPIVCPQCMKYIAPCMNLISTYPLSLTPINKPKGGAILSPLLS